MPKEIGATPMPPIDQTPDSDDARLRQVLQHPIRVALLRLLSEGDSLTPVAALGQLDSSQGMALSNVAYHASVLERAGLLERATAEQAGREGPVYRASPAGRDALATLDPPPEDRKD